MEKFKAHIKYLLAITLALHFIFNGAFVHTHTIEGETISHSHPFTSNQHNAADAAQIKLFNTAPYITSAQPEIPFCSIIYTDSADDFYIYNYTYSATSSILLRAPPVLF